VLALRSDPGGATGNHERKVGDEGEASGSNVSLVGILQNSEFCWKLLSIRPELCSDVPVFNILFKLEPMNLDQSYDIGVWKLLDCSQ